MLPEPIAIAFANTRSSSHRDRIATLAQWRAWVDTWPGLRPAGHAVDVEGLLALRATRDNVQLLLHSATGEGRWERDCLKLFIASRPDRRWCDSAICGNRARVRAHYRRQRD
jgi:predicted RNA-binding Zn ribbon-like protein